MGVGAGLYMYDVVVKSSQVRCLISWWVLVIVTLLRTKIVWTVVRWRWRPRCRQKTGESVQSLTITDQSRSRHQCARASPQLCIQSAPDFIHRFTFGGVQWASDGQKWPWPLVTGDITRLDFCTHFRSFYGALWRSRHTKDSAETNATALSFENETSEKVLFKLK